MIDITLAQKAGAWVWDKFSVVSAALGLGSGVGVVKFLKHIPAPHPEQKWAGSVFDTLQDLVSNDRIGERLMADGTIVYVKVLRQPAPPQGQELPKPPAAPPTGADPTKGNQ